MYYSYFWCKLSVTNSMENGPSWESNRFSAIQGILRILCNPNVHYRSHKSPQFFSNVSHINPVHAKPSNFLEIHFNIMFTSTPRSSRWSLSCRSSYLNPVGTSPFLHAYYIPCPFPSYFLIIRIIYSEQYRSQSSTLCNILHFSVISSFLGPNTLQTVEGYFYCNGYPLSTTFPVYLSASFRRTLANDRCITTWTCWQLYSYRKFTLEPHISLWLTIHTICAMFTERRRLKSIGF